MPIVRRSRRLSNQTIPDPLDQCVPGGFDYLDIPYPATEPLPEYPVVITATFDQPLSPQTIEHLSAFADQRELTLPDLHSQCRPRKGKNGNAPRPPNAFMLFRSDFWKFNKETIPERDHRQISRIAAHCWNALAEPRKVPYQEQARKLKDEHAQLYPQHKYNLSAKERVKERAPKKVKKEDIDNDELCGFIAAQVAQDVKSSKYPKTSGSSESGLLDQIVEQKVTLKRPRSSSAVAIAGRVSKDELRASQPPAKKRKRNPRKPSIAAVPVSEVQSQTGPPHLSTPLFVPTNEIPVLTLPPSPGSPAVEVGPLQDAVLGVVAQIIAVVEKGPTLSPPPMVELPKAESSEFEVPELPASVSPRFSPFDYESPVQYQLADAVVDKGLQISEHYGLSGPTEGLDFGIFEHLGDASATGSGDGHDEFDDEFAKWCRSPSYE